MPKYKIDPNNVKKKQCKTCPFKADSPLHKLTHRLMIQVTRNSNQICHQAQLSGENPTQICRGARDFQLRIFHQLGVLDEPTDVEWKRVCEKMNITEGEVNSDF